MVTLNKNLTVIIGAILLLLPILTFAQAHLKLAKGELDDLITRVDFGNKEEDITDIRLIQEKIDYLVQEMGRRDFDQSIIDYFRARYANADMACERYLLERERVHWTEVDKLNGLKRKLGYLLRIKTRTEPGKSFESPGAIQSKFGNLNGRELSLVDISSRPSREECSSIYSLFSEELNREIAISEKFIFDILVPDTTIRQLEAYVVFAVHTNETRNDSHLAQAYNKLYEFYTKDGQLTTLNLYEKSFSKETLSSFQIYQNHLKDKFERDKKIAAELEKYFLQGQSLTEWQYDAILTKAPNKELAFLALQSIIKNYLIVNKDYDKAIEKVESFLRTNGLSGENIKKANDLLSILKKIRSQDSNLVLSPIQELNTNRNETQYIFDETGNLILIPPKHPREQLRCYQASKNEWTKLDCNGRFNLNNIFWFDDGETSKDKIVSIPKRHFDVTDLGNRHFFRDFFVSYSHNVAFFVSDSPFQRRFIESGSKEKEYISPGLVNGQMGFQDYEDDQSQPYHGKSKGNANSDIYYSIRKGRDWRRPKILKGVNTPYSERSPILSDNGKILYFSSEGMGGLGGYDAYQVRISIVGSEVIIEPASLKNISQINSPYDELFYQEKNGNQYVSSNRKGKGGKEDFDIYKLIPAIEEPEIVEPKDSEDIQRTLVELSGINFELICRALNKDGKNAKEGHIFMEGRIVDENQQPFQKALIKFIAAGVDKPFQGEIDLEKYPYDYRYSVQLPYGRRYTIQVFGYNEQGDTVEAYAEKDIRLCTPETPNAVAEQDWELVKKGKGSLQDDCIVSSMPFFFKTAQYSLYDGLLNLDMIRKYYDEVALSAFESNPSIRLILTGYADERGEVPYNLELAKNRVASAKRFLKQAGFPEENIITQTIGETINFNGDDIEKYQKYFDHRISFAEQYNSIQSINYLLNRRVQVVITANPEICIQKL